jgi:hypothetical protein
VHSLTWRESLTGQATCSSNFNHLSHLERVLYKLANKPHAVQHCVATTANGENRHGLSNRLSNDRIVSRLWLWDRDSTHRLNLFRQRMSRLSRNQHRLSPKSTQDFSPRFQNCTRSLAEVGRVHAQAVEGRMEEEPPSRLISGFYLHGLGLTLVTHETACVPSACIPICTCFPLPGT